jgi:hypothetical protein
MPDMLTWIGGEEGNIVSTGRCIPQSDDRELCGIAMIKILAAIALALLIASTGVAPAQTNPGVPGAAPTQTNPSSPPQTNRSAPSVGPAQTNPSAPGIAAAPTNAATPTSTTPATAVPSQQLLNSGQLDALVAPIALYPDPLISEVLMASTYPLEVVEAARWVAAHKGLKGAQLKAEVMKQSWDESVKSLTATPSWRNRWMSWALSSACGKGRSRTTSWPQTSNRP